MTDLQKVELDVALDAVRLLADSARSITLEWKLDESPAITFVPNAGIEYISVNFTVQDGSPFGVDAHINCPCWATGTYQRVEGCKDHPYDL